MAISKPWVWINRQLQILCNFQQMHLGQTFLFLLEIRYPLHSILKSSNWNLTPSSTNTQNMVQVKKECVWIYHGMHFTLSQRSKLCYTDLWKARIWLPTAFQTLKPSEAKPSFRKVSLPLAKLAAHRTDLSTPRLSGILTQRGGNKEEEEYGMAPSAAQGAGKRVEIKF